MMLYFAGVTALVIASNIIDNSFGNLYFNIITNVTFPFIWGTYSPYSYQVIVLVVTYFLFYKKFQWLSPFMFMFVWGFNDIFYNAYFDAFHIEPLLNGQLPSHIPQGWGVYLGKMLIEGVIMCLGAFMLRLKFDFSYGFTKYFGLTLVICNVIYVLVVGFPTLASAVPVLDFQAGMALIGLMMFMYTSVESRV
jgi:hypothetical protein